ncbi:3-deoxy-7-phosphoheptulonate synthase [Polyangium mundeleinium]|uniref:3-deoxy-7-phosphoheptulonate synthase n=1 Tax=Polyangium mundeleinium TaxID=2995306 RepID=A0ABT5ER10_9BACT|nr:3-deoxy-7-phosphoheptulonate synthase [Polyangium mundeleinium]MDC0744274.1 3-deoxy-7-phosphoheptulonate synthase [Polyangium mundeleinium]
MIVSLKSGADAANVLRELTGRGLWVSRVERSASGNAVHYVIAPHSQLADPEELARIDGVAEVTTPKPAHPLVSAQGPVVDVGGLKVGTDKPVFMCGPCSLESEAQVHETASVLSSLGVSFIRGGAFKPRTSPYAFQGHGDVALEWVRRAADAAGMRVVTEALGEGHVSAVAAYADLVQVGSRNMQNFSLLKAIGKTEKPVLLKRGMSATIEEWLLAGEYLLSHGSKGVIFCERGIRGFDDSTRNLLDIGAVALLRYVHRLPVVVDPSHGLGRRDLVAPLGRAALAAGAAGLMIETHPDPSTALSDGPQAVPLGELGSLLGRLVSAEEAR